MHNELKSNPQKTMLVICIGFLGLFLLFSSEILLWIAFIAGLSGVVSETLSKQIEKLWFLIAGILGRISPVILLTLVYFCIVFPLGLLSRLFRKKDLLDLKNSKKSMFKEHSIQYSRTYFENMW